MIADAAYIMERPVTFIDEPYVDPETALVERCRAGEAGALRALYETHRAAVYRVVARMIEIEADREETLQEVFLQVFRSLSSFKGQSQLKTWVHRIAMNVILQQLRRKRYRIRLQLTDSPPEVTPGAQDPQTTPEEAAIAKEKQWAVQRALAQLPPKKRAVLVLHDFEGVTAKEISKIVNTSVMTVRTRLFYAREAFYAKLGAEPCFSESAAKEV
jgi:RNA polymerase sigma-70 factor (ECF subfamily)